MYAKEFLEKNTELIPTLIQELIRRILVDSKVKPDGKANICLYECWNLLQDIVKNKAIMSYWSLQIEEKLTDVFELMKTEGEMSFDYNLIEIANSVMEYKKDVSDYFLDK